MTRDKPNGELTRPVEILLRLSSKQSGVIYPACSGKVSRFSFIALRCIRASPTRDWHNRLRQRALANPHRIGPVAWAIVCLAEQNIMMNGLGFPLRRSQELREVARTLVDSIR
jgi:hypothetical protein